MGEMNGSMGMGNGIFGMKAWEWDNRNGSMGMYTPSGKNGRMGMCEWEYECIYLFWSEALHVG